MLQVPGDGAEDLKCARRVGVRADVNGQLQGTTAFSSPWKATGHTTIGPGQVERRQRRLRQRGHRRRTHDIPRPITAREAYALGTGTAGYYQLDEGSGQTVTNSFGNSDDGYI